MIVQNILQLCKTHQQTIATAESCTGGMIAAQLTDPPGASLMFERGFVTYSNSAKIQQLGVKEDTLNQHGAVSEEVAAQMAQGALHHSNATLALSVTGIAGPGGSEFKPEGLVCFGIAHQTKLHSQKVTFGALGRHAIRSNATRYALQMLHTELCKLLNI
jgi:nicotinamide-nucleotide amidase